MMVEQLTVSAEFLFRLSESAREAAGLQEAQGNGDISDDHLELAEKASHISQSARDADWREPDYSGRPVADAIALQNEEFASLARTLSAAELRDYLAADRFGYGVREWERAADIDASNVSRNAGNAREKLDDSTTNKDQ